MALTKKYVLLFLLIGFAVTAQNKDRKFISCTPNQQLVEIKTNDGHYRIQPLSSKIVETSFIPSGEKYSANSHAVVLTQTNNKFKVVEKEQVIQLQSNGINIQIIKSPFQIIYSFNNKVLISERMGYVKSKTHEILDFNVSEKEVLYGGGARALGMNRRGNSLKLYNRAHYGYETHSELMNYTMPLVLSSKLYAVHFDNAPIGYLELDSKNDNSLQYMTISGRKTYQVVAGENWDDLMDQYTNLTGKQPLIPRWALGNFSSRFGYHSQRETLETINKFESENIPVDAIILDLYWFGKDIMGTMGNLEFYRDSFPEPKKMIAQLQNKGVKTILVTEPFILTTSNKWDEAVNKDILGKTKEGKPYRYDFYFGNTGILDIFKPEGKQWFWEVYEKFTNCGVAGWWGDLGEPEVHPSDLIHTAGTADEVHNIYGHNWAKLIFEGYRKKFPEQRPFILMRAGYSGSQNYGMIPWSGDVNRTWGGLQSQPEIALQMGMQGLGYMHSDLGGFAGNNLDNELYVRWLQYGVFQPIYRPHAQEEVPSEPVFRETKTKALAKKAIELRYRLMPYNYTLAFQNSQYGTPLMRPLFFEEKKPELYQYDKAYFWGKNLLISPVLQSELKMQEVYFPVASNWFDFYTDEKISGGQTLKVSLYEDRIPTYVRGGAFIPMIPVIQNTSFYSLEKFDLHFYSDKSVKESKDILYNDDGLTPDASLKGMYELFEFRSKTKGKNIVISIDTKKGHNFNSSLKEINLIIHNIFKKPKKIRGYKFVFNEKRKTLQLKIKIMSEEKKFIKIKF